MQRFLSPHELAQTVGVSESSVKRWVDEGRLTVTRTIGGHRRIGLREALRFIRETRLPVVDPQPLGVPDLVHLKPSPAPDADAALQEALLAGRGEEVRGLTLAMYLSGRDVAGICDGPLTAALHRVGMLWKEGPAGIHREHRSTELCAQTLYYLGALLPTPQTQAPLALGGALESDPYLLPSLMVATTLASLGWRAMNLGPNLPFDALLAAVDLHSPDLVWLSCSVPVLPEQHTRALRKAARVLADRGVELVVGGRGWLPASISESPLQTVRFIRTMRELAAFAEGLRIGEKK